MVIGATVANWASIQMLILRTRSIRTNGKLSCEFDRSYITIEVRCYVVCQLPRKDAVVVMNSVTSLP